MKPTPSHIKQATTASGRWLRPLLVTAAIALSAAAGAQPQQDCSAAEHHQFDFWVGEWEVFVGDKLAGRNTIRAQLDGCSLHEDWRGEAGLSGQSFNTYDRRAKQWRQFWVDNRGGVLQLQGELGSDGVMRLQSATQAQVIDRISWEPLSEGEVRQRWEQSNDGGAEWKEVFNGLYRRVERSER